VLLVSVAVAPLLPRRDARAAPSPPRTGSRRSLVGRVPLPPALCILAVALFYVTIGSYWAYAERMGIEFGISMQRVHWLLTAGVVLSAAACLSARAVGDRIGQSGRSSRRLPSWLPHCSFTLRFRRPPCS